LIKILQNHITKINPDKKGEYVYKSKKFGEHPWLWFVFAAIQEVEKLKSFGKTTPEGQACDLARTILQNLANTMLGDDKSKTILDAHGQSINLVISPKVFIDRMKEQESKGIDFKDFDLPGMLSLREDIEAFRAKTLFYCPRDIQVFAATFSEQNYPIVLHPYLDSYRKGIFADIFYAATLTVPKVFTVLVIPFYQAFFKRDLASSDTIDATFNAWLRPTAGLTADQKKAAKSFNAQVVNARERLKSELNLPPGEEPGPEPSDIDLLVDALEGLRDKLKALARGLGSF
jgi:hypothetical protein